MSIHFKRLGMFEAIAMDDAETDGEREVHKAAVGHLANRAKLIRDLM